MLYLIHLQITFPSIIEALEVWAQSLSQDYRCRAIAYIEQRALVDRNSPERFIAVKQASVFQVLWQGALAGIYTASQPDLSSWEVPDQVLP